MMISIISKEIETLYPSPALQIPNNVEDDDSIKFKTIGEESITIPAETFDALKIRYEIETSEGEHSVIDQWLVKNIGRVKLHVDMDATDLSGSYFQYLAMTKLNSL